MTDTTQRNQWFGEARALFDAAPPLYDEDAAHTWWRAVWAHAVSATTLFDAEELCEVVIPFLDQRLSVAPDDLRFALKAPEEWATTLAPLARCEHLSLNGEIEQIQAALAALSPRTTSLATQADSKLLSLALPERIRSLWLGKSYDTTRLQDVRGDVAPRALRSLSVSVTVFMMLDLFASFSVEHLTLYGKLTPQALEVLLTHPHARRLEALRLVSPNMNRPALERLVSARAQLPHLSCLTIHGMPMWPQLAAGLAKHIALPSLRHLGLDRCHLGDDELLALLADLDATRLESLDLRHNRLSAAACRLVIKELGHMKLRLDDNWWAAASVDPLHLRLDARPFPADRLASLASCVDLARLQTITLRSTPVVSEDLLTLTRLELPSLHTLTLMLRGDGVHVAPLLTHDRWPALAHLILDHSYLCDLDALIALLPTHPRLSLSLNHCWVTSASIARLVDAVAFGWRPPRLGLSQTAIHHEALETILRLSPETVVELEHTLVGALRDPALDTLVMGPYEVYFFDESDAAQRRRLFADPAWSTLRALELKSDYFSLCRTERALVDVLRGDPDTPDHLARLELLMIHDDGALDVKRSILALCAALPQRLRVLCIHEHGLTLAELAALLAALDLPELEVLSVTINSPGRAIANITPLLDLAPTSTTLRLRRIALNWLDHPLRQDIHSALARLAPAATIEC